MNWLILLWKPTSLTNLRARKARSIVPAGVQRPENQELMCPSSRRKRICPYLVFLFHLGPQLDYMISATQSTESYIVFSRNILTEIT